MPGHNDDLISKHWLYEIRNCLFNVTDEQLVSMLSNHYVERERLRACLATIDENEEKED
jgi:hypothetical protein